MSKPIGSFLPCEMLAVALACVMYAEAQPLAQAPLPTLARPDSPQVKPHVDAARKSAGQQWAVTFDYACGSAPQGPEGNVPAVEPMKVFDNLYFIGNKATLVYAITTPEGIILIDSFYADRTESVLISGMQKLGLDPATVKYVIVAHGHADHFGGAAYFQQHYNSRVALSAADWDFIQPKPGAPPAAVTLPKRDLVMVEGQPIVLGDEKVTPVFIPGHTPGSVGLIFPVKDGGKTHVVGLFGGAWLKEGFGRVSTEGLQQYISSLDHFAEMTRKMNVDTELQNHPVFDGTFEKAAKLQARKKGEPNPFIVGESGYRQFMNVWSECMKAVLAGRES